NRESRCAMAQPRDNPFIWATWLVDVASGRRSCHWKYWFKARYNHDKRPTDFDFSGWKLKHTRMLTNLRRTLISEGGRVRIEVPMTLAWNGCTIMGKADCVQELPSEVIYYDCKGGQADDTHRIQLQIYMWMDRRQNLHPGKPLSGYIVYEND